MSSWDEEDRITKRYVETVKEPRTTGTGQPWNSQPSYWIGYLDALRYARFETEAADDLEALLRRLKRRRDDVIATHAEELRQ